MEKVIRYVTKSIGLPLVFLLALALSACAPTRPTEFPDPENYVWLELPFTFMEPVQISNAGDGTGRLFVVEKRGRVFVIYRGERLPNNFMNISKNVNSEGNEQGLYSIAFHPDYENNGYLYVTYTNLQDDLTLSRFQVSDSPNKVSYPTEKILLVVDQPKLRHQAGHLEFGKDGYLYMSIGDGGNDKKENNSQSPDNLLGTIIRIDVDNGEPYAIPQDNLYTDSSARPEIWAYGLRNPWRFTFDQATQEMYIADVGQDEWEEIDYLPADYEGDANFGWHYFEATYPYSVDRPDSFLILTPPVVEYKHELARCSIIGGVVYRGKALPAWRGIYLYGDFCSGEIFGMFQGRDGVWQTKILYNLPINITSFGVNEEGEVYVIGYGEGPQMYMLSANEGQLP